MPEPSLQRLVIPLLARGWDPTAPPRALRPEGSGPLWRDLHNFRIHDGALFRRAALTALSGGSVYPTVQANDTQVTGNAQLPVAISSHAPSQDNDIASLLVVTTREIHLYRAGTWHNLTPVYEVGTVNVASGSTTVTAASGSPLWATRSILQGNLIQLPKGTGSWHRISSATDTTITLAAPYAGSTLSGAAYSIRRVQPTGKPHFQTKPTFATIFNGDLYLAGPYYTNDAWVLTVRNVWGFPVPSPASILTATVQIEAGTDPLPDVGSNFRICGIELLDDGRIVITGTDNGFEARAYYSSHLNQAVWSASPGGYTDVTSIPGPIRALGKLGPNIALHYDEGIAFGVPTGEDDPPLAYRRTTASVGCWAPRTLRNFGGTQVYLARDGNVYTFDGATSRPIGEPVRHELKAFRRSSLANNAHASIDPYRGEYLLWVPQAGDSDNERALSSLSQVKETLQFALSAVDGQWRKSKYAVLIGAVSDHMAGEPLAIAAAEGQRRKGVCYVGTPSYDPFAASTGGATSSMLYKLDETSTSDVSLGFSGSPSIGGISATSDDIDFDAPGIDKTISHVTVWFKSASTESENFSVALSSNGGTSWTTVTAAASLVANDEVFTHFFFEPAAAEKWRLRLQCPTGAENGMAAVPTRVVIWYALLSEVETVAR